MSSEPKKFTKEEKAAIALKAVSGDDAAKQELAEKHGVTVEIIEKWVRETGVQPVSEEDVNEVTLEASDDFKTSVDFGAVPDKLNYPRLVFWSIFGTAVIVVMIFALMAIYSYTIVGTEQQQSEVSLYFDINELQQRDQATLGSFGVVDPEERIYRIPIDSAITIMAQDTDD
ncbi:MAG: hypothetical protein EA390_09320 [Balneolaceae bacterium]|nr:MAG: hypothetical protein EA390_09320 [Balneolaceae bacterium]